MLLIILIIQITAINCLNITDTTYKIKYILNKYKSSHRQRRCLSDTKISNFVENTLNLLQKTERISDFLRHRNISDCLNSASDHYVKNHILEGLLIHHDVPEFHWDEYKKVYNKQYPTIHHEKSAFEQWRENLHLVAQHNQEYLAGKQSYSLHLNHFSDLSATDYFKKFLKLLPTIPLFDPAKDHHKTAYKKSLRKCTPKRMDWRTKGFKPRLEEQYQCGACYAFAVAHALQAQVFRKHGDWRELSPQQIVDCSLRDGNAGCEGGSLPAAMRYVARAGLIMERHYPYSGKKGNCKYNAAYVTAKPRRWATLPIRDEKAMERALATIGPLAVGVNAGPITFKLYRSGIYDDPFCTSWTLNHAMLLVGYTPEYWILLNWWGKNWGEKGYMRIRRGFNICGVANMATYVEL